MVFANDVSIIPEKGAFVKQRVFASRMGRGKRSILYDVKGCG
jgi:hypothetical protein